MFGNRFAYQFQGSERGNWTPPWLREDWHGPRFFAMRRGHGPFGFRFGPGGPFGSGGEGNRFFGRGDMKFALLSLLQERPMHGYEMMKALEEKTGGFYSPSPGSVYPTLQMLEDGGYVTAREVDGKKIYSITDAGRALLAERQQNTEEFAGPPWMGAHGRRGQWQRPEIQALRSEMRDAARLLAIAARMSFQDPQQIARLRAIVEHTRKELADMIYGAGSQQEQSSTTSISQSEDPNVDQA